MRAVLNRAVLFFAVLALGAPLAGQELLVHFIDVGSGDAIWIQAPGDLDILIDGGDNGSFGRIRGYPFIKEYFQNSGGTPRLPDGSTIELVMLTHPHSDHYGGLSELLNDNDYTVLHVVDSGGRPETGGYGTFVNRARTRSTHHLARDVITSAGGTRTLDFAQLGIDPGALTLEVLVALDMADPHYASFDFDHHPSTELNNASTVLRLVFGDVSVLLTGDAEGKGDISGSDDFEDELAMAEDDEDLERFLMEEEARGEITLDCDVLKLGHHGSESSSSIPFLEAVDPEVVVVSSGLQRFADRPGTTTMLPKESTLFRVKQILPGVSILRTDRYDRYDWMNGAVELGDEGGDDHILMTTDGVTFSIDYVRKPKECNGGQT